MIRTETSTMESFSSLQPGQNHTPKPRSKSRSGCLTCKSRRLKCDEQKPFCLNCTKKKIKCGGYATRFKWRSFNDSTPETPSEGDAQSAKSKKRSRSSVSETIQKPVSASNASSVRSNSASWSDSGNLNSLSSATNTPMDVSASAGASVSSPEKLSLKQHLELTSLSVLGKTTKEIKLENSLLAKGINPDTYFDNGEYNNIRAAKKMRRSYSTNEVANRESIQSLQRSYSASSPQVPADVSCFRNELQSASGLQSLAEAAVDEIHARTPEGTPRLVSHENSVYAPSHMTNNTSNSPEIMNMVQNTKDWQLQPAGRSPVHAMAPAVKDAISDLNLTPSLSALFNFVFTNPDHARPDSNGLNGMGLPFHEAVLSPLDLSSASISQNGSQSPEMGFKRPEVVVSRNEDESMESPDSNPLLSDVGTQLIRHKSASPSITIEPTSMCLLKTSEHQQILYLYSTYTCGIMSIKSGAAENPWRNIYLPLASEYSYLFNSIASMTLFHLAGNAKIREHSLALRSKGFSYMKKCILELATGLSRLENGDVSDNQLPADVALATCLNLAVSESWDTHTSSGIAHLKGAKSMIQKVIGIITQYACKKQRRQNVFFAEDHKKKLALVTDEEWRKIEDSDGAQESTSIQGLYIPKNIQLLFNEWIYFEVLSQMTSHSGHDDKGIDLVATITKAIHINQKERDVQDQGQDAQDSPTDSHGSGSVDSLRHGFSFFDNLDTMLQNNEYVDPLLGCAQSLFSIMGKVANLISKVRKSHDGEKRHQRNSLSNITLASELKRQLMDWKPSVATNVAGMLNEDNKDSTWDLYSCVSTAEAYKYATLLYLHEAVPEVPSISSHQLAEKVFVLLASIPSSSNLYIVHIFPLLVSSCEAEPGEEREWCEARWALLIERIWIGNIDRAFEVVKEVWRRKDEFKRNSNRDSTRDLGRDAGDTSDGFDDPRNISAHLREVVAAMRRNPSSDEKGITSRLHWSSVMREWGWEVLLA